MHRGRLDDIALMNDVDADFLRITTERHSFDIRTYLQRWLPLEFPNKGVEALARDGATVEVHHECLNVGDCLLNLPMDRLESMVDQYGSTHQRDYCLVVLGHRFDEGQSVQFRGILGHNRLYKLLLALRLAGFSQSQIRVVDHEPDYEQIIHRDLENVLMPGDVVFVGGEVVVGPFLSESFALIKRTHGNIVSLCAYRHGDERIVMTSFPYGDLSQHVVQSLAKMGAKSVYFIGSAGTISKGFSAGNVIAPTTVFDCEGRIVSRSVENSFAKGRLPGVKLSQMHCSVKTPLVETQAYLKRLSELGCESVDVEAAHFQKGCEDSFSSDQRAGILLYIVDMPGSTQTLAQHDYAKPDIIDMRRNVAKLVEVWLRRYAS